VTRGRHGRELILGFAHFAVTIVSLAVTDHQPDNCRNFAVSTVAALAANSHVLVPHFNCLRGRSRPDPGSRRYSNGHQRADVLEQSTHSSLRQLARLAPIDIDSRGLCLPHQGRQPALAIACAHFADLHIIDRNEPVCPPKNLLPPRTKK